MQYQLAAAGKRMSWHCLNSSASGSCCSHAVHAVPAGCSWEAHALAVLEFVRLWLFCCSHAVHAVPAGCSWEAHAFAVLEFVRLWLFCCSHAVHAVPAGCSWEAHALAVLECVRICVPCSSCFPSVRSLEACLVDNVRRRWPLPDCA